MSKTLDVYTIRQIDNGFLLTIHEESAPIMVGDADYFDTLGRLITHLTEKFDEKRKEEE